MQPQHEPTLPARSFQPAEIAPRWLLWGTAPAVLVASSLAWLAIRGVDHRFISFSDGAYTYAASVAGSHGAQQLYRAIPLSLPPGVVLGASLVWHVSPHVEAIRTVLALIGLVTALLTYAVARVVFRLRPGWAAAAAVLALTGPVSTQFVGLEGEVVITPLVLLLALGLAKGRIRESGALMAAGFFFKLTWAPFFVAAVLELVRRFGWRRAATTTLGALTASLLLYGIAIWSFGWSAHALLSQLVLAEMHSGSQLRLLPALVVATLVLWWPFVVLAPVGLEGAPRAARYVFGAGALSALYMLKQGTFFNVLAPLEPFLAILGAAGACSLWSRREVWQRALVGLCAVGAAIHVASVADGRLARALPLPVAGNVVNTDDEPTVDRLAGMIDAHSRPNQAVLVNPFLAVVAHRREASNAADWFILNALQDQRWSSTKRLAREGDVPVVSVDSNVVSFDPSFQRDVGLSSFRRLAGVDVPPLETTIYVRARPPR